LFLRLQMGTYDGYWEMNYEKAKSDAQELKTKFWVIRNGNDKDVTPPKIHPTEESAWKSVVQHPFNASDYKKKGYHAVQINVNQFKQELDRMKSREYV